VEALEGHFGALEGSNLEKSEWSDPDPEPHQSERKDPDRDPHLHQSEKQDPHQDDADPQHCLTVVENNIYL
jgi:hypothetical protein